MTTATNHALDLVQQEIVRTSLELRDLPPRPNAHPLDFDPRDVAMTRRLCELIDAKRDLDR